MCRTKEIIMEPQILTDDQRRQWKTDGYILLKGVLSAEEVKNLTTVVDRMYAEYLLQPDWSLHPVKHVGGDCPPT
jgi:hypothetical protein